MKDEINVENFMKWICYYWETNILDSCKLEQYIQWSLAH
jgi:hypothetical protein